MPKDKKTKKTEIISRQKGMRDIVGNDFYAYQGFFEKAAEIAMYYGFKPIHTPAVEQREVFASGIGSDSDIVKKEMYSLKSRRGANFVLRPEGTAAVMRAYVENGMHTEPQPVMLYYYGPFWRHERPQRGRFREFFQFGLESLGSSQSVLDALVIQIVNLILEEVGFKNNTILINSIGCKDCKQNYLKALTTYYKKNISSLCSDCKERLKRNPLRLLDCKNENCQGLKTGAPETVAYLCEACKTHFKEVLEYVDAQKTTYKIDNTLVRGIDYYTRTVFEIINEKEITEKKEDDSEKNEILQDKKDVVETKNPAKNPLSLAAGGRYDYLAKNFYSKRDIPAVGGAIGVDRVVSSPLFKNVAPRIIKKPKVYFIQIGFEAKIKSFAAIEILRKARIPIVHSLSKDKLSVQIAIAEKSKIPFVVILGQKEALDGTVIVRSMSSRSQDSVKLERLAEYMKKKL